MSCLFVDPSSKEEELTKVTESFNKKLGDNPSDVDLWLEYVSFQVSSKYETIYRSHETVLALFNRGFQCLLLPLFQ